jgi:peptidyl-prolyl cis-trans isomerase B (cyclophilin B)
MANKRARDRQLAKLAARRQAERQIRQRRRARIVGGVTGLLVIGMAVAGYAALTGDDGTQAGPSATPPASPAAAVACGADVPRSVGEEKPTFDRPPKMTIDPQRSYSARMQTSCGPIELELYPDVAPIGVNSFVFLAKKGFYDGLTFHRIVQDFVIQGGDPTGTGSGDAGYKFEIEIDEKVTFDDGGLLAYANSGPDTNGSQFFITVGPTPELDAKGDTGYTIFGKVTGGMDVVQTIEAVPTTDNGRGEQSLPLETVYIDSVSIEEPRAA